MSMKPPCSIQSDTPIRPQIIALCVWEEAGLWLGETLPRRWVRELAAEANTVYANNERFRRRIQGKLAKGRDYLWMFMRHWLAAKLWEHRPHLYARLPSAYSLGEDLPAKPHSIKLACPPTLPWPAETRSSRSARNGQMHVRFLGEVSL